MKEAFNKGDILTGGQKTALCISLYAVGGILVRVPREQRTVGVLVRQQERELRCKTFM